MKRSFTLLFFFAFVFAGFSQCYPDRHSTNWYDGWVSCDMRDNPVSDLGESHWIMYEFAEPMRLGQLKIWNGNDPGNLDRGIQEAYISVSMDFVNWQTTGPHYFEQGTGFNDYEGFSGPVVNKQARFLVITAASTYGSTCASLGEVKINILDDLVTTEDEEEDVCFEAFVAPNPFATDANIIINSECEAPLLYSINNSMGQTIEQGVYANGDGQHTIQLINWQQPAGTYYLRLKQNGFSRYFSLLKTQ